MAAWHRGIRFYGVYLAILGSWLLWAAKSSTAVAEPWTPPIDAVRSTTGLASKVLKPGSGESRPGPRDMVTIHYTGWMAGGEMIDTTRKLGTPVSLHLHWAMPGWTEGIQLMTVGETRRLWIPEALAYRGASGRPKGALIYDVELLEFVATPRAPADVGSVPDDAARTSSGLAWRVLKPSASTRHPTATSIVTMHFTAWRADGTLFKSSEARGQPITFRLNEVIAGWTEGAQLMVEGERRRFWIPGRLAYHGRPEMPQGMLVFDLELLTIRE